MTFSVEPGLYDPERGFGYNPSDNLLVTKQKGVLQGSVPYTKEWMILKLQRIEGLPPILSIFALQSDYLKPELFFFVCFSKEMKKVD